MTAAVIATSQVAVIAALSAEVDAGRHEFTPSQAQPERCGARETVAGLMPCHMVEGHPAHKTSRRIIAALENGGRS